MKLTLRNASYLNPLTKRAFANAIVVDGIFSDDPINKTLTQSFRIQRPVVAKTVLVNPSGSQSTQSVASTQTLAEASLVFEETSHENSFVVKKGEKRELFAFLDAGGLLDEVESLHVGYPSYDEVKTFFYKKGMGSRTEINPHLDANNNLLARQFVLERVLINGEPIGKQFKF